MLIINNFLQAVPSLLEFDAVLHLHPARPKQRAPVELSGGGAQQGLREEHVEELPLYTQLLRLRRYGE